ncbi:MAG: MBL fold metallo-hydrolase, partial [Acidimicrobiales bacterium]
PPHHRAGGGFRNPWPVEGAGDWNRLGALVRGGRTLQVAGLVKWLVIDRLMKPLPVDPDPTVFPRVRSAHAMPRAPDAALVITWIGHSTFLIQVGGLNLLTDPIWSERASPVPFAGPLRWVPPAIPIEALPPIDVVLVSHNHYDHLDRPTVRRLAARDSEATWVAPLGLAAFLRRRGARRVHELDWWDEVAVGPVTLACTPARHFSSRHVADRNRTLWCGWAMAAAARRVYFAGDTAYHPDFTAIGRRLGPFEALLLPIGAYEPRWFMRSVHMMPEEAVQAFRDVQQGRPAALVPMHWGTFKLTDEAMDEPPARVQAAWDAAGPPAGRLWVPSHGETRQL